MADVKCGWCNGKGRVPAHWYGAKKRCPECLGSGSVPEGSRSAVRTALMEEQK